jgi:hypothetical protein
MMKQLYGGDDCTDKYSRNSLEHLASRKRKITRKKHFVEYYRDFAKCTHNMHKRVSDEDKNRLFWKGLPKDLQKDIFNELQATLPTFDQHNAPDIKLIQDTALNILDKNSLYADLTVSQGKNQVSYV